MNYIKLNNYLLILCIYLFAIAGKCGSSGTNDKKSSSNTTNTNTCPGVGVPPIPGQGGTSQKYQQESTTESTETKSTEVEKNNQETTQTFTANTGERRRDDQEDNNAKVLLKEVEGIYECTQKLLTTVTKALDEEKNYLKKDVFKTVSAPGRILQNQKDSAIQKRTTKLSSLENALNLPKVKKDIEGIKNKKPNEQVEKRIIEVENNMQQIEAKLQEIRDCIKKIQHIPPKCGNRHGK